MSANGRAAQPRPILRPNCCISAGQTTTVTATAELRTADIDPDQAISWRDQRRPTMTKMIFVNLPVIDLARAKAFYGGPLSCRRLGFAAGVPAMLTTRKSGKTTGRTVRPSPRNLRAAQTGASTSSITDCCRVPSSPRHPRSTAYG